jgi:glucoamylase
MWLDSQPYWNGIQLDETAFPILLLALARREGVLQKEQVNRFWPMVRKAAGYLVRNGPVTPQDRWEEESGLSPFTLAVEITALLVAAELADEHGEPEVATFLRETADNWNARIETWTYVIGTGLAKQHGVEGYYVRIAPPDVSEESKVQGLMPVKHRPVEDPKSKVIQTISPDALALVRFGLRAADDPRIRNTVKVIDAMLKVDFPWGPGWHRYNGDFYGEHADGAPFDGSGIGRIWPLLTGERAHYEIAAGNMDEARCLCQAMAGFAGEGGLLPEQSWDTEDIPERGLFFGRPSGSAMPLVWAHAEYVKLLRSLRDGKIFDMPHHACERYLGKEIDTPFFLWRFNHKSRRMPAGRTLRIEVLAPAEITWTHDGWQSTLNLKTRNSGLGLFVADLPTKQLAAGTDIIFTFYWPQAGRWEGANFEISIVELAK